MRTMCHPGYNHNGFVATHELGHMMYMMYIYIYICITYLCIYYILNIYYIYVIYIMLLLYYIYIYIICLQIDSKLQWKLSSSEHSTTKEQVKTSKQEPRTNNPTT